jgi:hypothetical protein
VDLPITTVVEISASQSCLSSLHWRMASIGRRSCCPARRPKSVNKVYFFDGYSYINVFFPLRLSLDRPFGTKIRLHSIRTSRRSHTAELRLTYSSLNNTRQHGGDRHLDPFQLPLRGHHSHRSPTPQVHQRMPMHDLQTLRRRLGLLSSRRSKD